MENLKHLITYLIIIIITFFVTRYYFTKISRPNNEKKCVIPQCHEPCKPPSAIISLDEVQKLYGGYVNLTDSIRDRNTIRGNELVKVNNLLKTRGVWFDYDDFKNYLSYIDQSAKSANIKISGLRFFPSISFSKNEKIGQLNLFYNPTFKVKQGNKQVDLAYMLVNENDKTFAVPLRDSLRTKINRFDNTRDQKKQISTGSFSSLFNISSTTTLLDVISQSGNGGQQSPPPHE